MTQGPEAATARVERPGRGGRATGVNWRGLPGTLTNPSADSRFSLWISSRWPSSLRSLNVILVDLVLAGDNAIVVGIAVAGLPVHQRCRVMVFGIAAATVLRIVFASLRCSCCRSSVCCWPAACCCSGFAGRCGASCARGARRHGRRPRSARGDRRALPAAAAARRRRCARPSRRSSSPTSRCRSTTCSPSPALRASTPGC